MRTTSTAVGLVLALALGPGATACKGGGAAQGGKAEGQPEADAGEATSAAAETGATTGEALDPGPRDPIMSAPDFRFEWQSASGAVLLDQLVVDADGSAAWIRPVGGGPKGGATLHQLELKIDAAELEALRAAVVEAKFMDLDPSCGGDDGIADGNLLFIRVRANAKVHRVACGERLPEALTAIRSAVARIETGERRGALEKAPAAPPGALIPDLEAPWAPAK